MSWSDDFAAKWPEEADAAFEHELYVHLGKSAVWKTRDGRAIKVCDMEDGHLLAAERFLRGDAFRKPNQPRRPSRQFIRDEWLGVLRAQIAERGLVPLPAITR